MITPRRTIDPAEVADHYDDLDSFYREVWGEHVHHGLWRAGTESTEEAVRQLVRHLAEQLGMGRGARVVDVGSGYGATARQLAEELDARVHAITLSPAQHAIASSRETGGSPSYHLGDWLANPFPDKVFDYAIAVESTEHMVDKEAAFRQLYRVLVPGGRVGVCAWIAADAPRQWMVDHLLEPICREGRLPGMGNEADYRELMRASGFEVESVEDLSARVAPTWRHSVARVAGRLLSDRRYRRYILDRASRNRDFALSLVRIMAAYRLGCMRYLLFIGRRPAAAVAHGTTLPEESAAPHSLPSPAD